MTAIPYSDGKRAEIKFRPVCEAVEIAEGGGFCLHCGETTPYCEPDGRRLKCESCGKPQVYGLEELLLMGILTLK